jgi:D-lactate dehydrogenase (cytochrome)
VTEQGAQLALRLPDYDPPRTKSAAGYFAADDMDAIDLFIGSDGTLGILSELELRLQPLPPLIWNVTCFFAEPAALVDFVVRVRQALPDDIIALEYFDAHVLDLLRRQKEQNPAYARLLTPPPRFQGAVCAELAAADEATALRVLDRLGDLVTQAGGRDDETWVARTAFDQDQLVFFRHAAPESVNQIIDQRRRSHPGLTKLGTDMSVPDDCLGQVLDLYRHDLAACGLESATWGHIGDNHVHVNILPRNQADYLAGQALYRAWAERVVALGGSVAAEHGIGKLKRALLHLMFGPAAIAEMRAVKQALDPQGRLGAGNLFLDAEAES